MCVCACMSVCACLCVFVCVKKIKNHSFSISLLFSCIAYTYICGVDGFFSRIPGGIHAIGTCSDVNICKKKYVLPKNLKVEKLIVYTASVICTYKYKHHLPEILTLWFLESLRQTALPTTKELSALAIKT